MSDRRISGSTPGAEPTQPPIGMERRRADRRRLERRYTDLSMEDWAPLKLSQRILSDSEGLTIRHDLHPGDIGWLVWLHGVIYARERGWDYTFEAYVAEPLAQFARRNNRRERIWLVECIDRISIAIDDRDRLEMETFEGEQNSMEYFPNQAPPDAYPSLVGSIAIVESSPEEAQLRWFLLTPELRGKGVGKKLFENAVAFARKEKYRAIFLWTTVDLDEASRVYQASGFKVVEEITHEIWGKEVTEQKWELELT